MKIATHFLSVVIAVSLGNFAGAATMTTTITYQGRLMNGSNPAQGAYDFTFSLWDAGSAGTLVGTTLTASNVGVSNGLFTAALDFGASAFNGDARWLQIGVRTGTNSFTALSPRQPLTAAPYALFSPVAGTAGQVMVGAISALQLKTPAGASPGQVLAYNGSSLSWTNAGSAANAWQIGGNSGTTPGTNYLGTADSQPMELKVNSQRALLLEADPASPAVNVIGGCADNFAGGGAYGVAIAGGGEPTMFNASAAWFGAIGGGRQNWIFEGAMDSAIAGGCQNWINTNATSGSIGGGEYNFIEANAAYSTIAGGSGGGIGAASEGSFIGGGAQNMIGDYAYGGVIAGGQNNSVGWNAMFGVVSGGSANAIGDAASAAHIGGGYANTNGGSYSVIAGGTNNVIDPGAQCAVIGGGELNYVATDTLNSTIAGGSENEIGAVYGGTVGGGYYNFLGDYADFATISGGYDNWVQGDGAFATIPGGKGAAAVSYGQLAYASGYTADYGDAQTSLFVLRGSTTNAVQGELFLDGLSSRMTVPTGGRWTFQVMLVAVTASGSSASFEAKGGVKNVGGTLSLIGGGTSMNATSLASEITGLTLPRIQTDNANTALVLKTTGISGQVIRWVARVQTVELIL
ncbi:MAG: hypothetical protein NTW03_06215 [Verrucomicrobia bacterium]|nr:hypothetical protein [Verrucomicrobiota bacterium]